jgi:UPF0716 family protein affecting phage T7 exclusion
MNAKLGPWLWGAPVDLAVFGGSALLALALVVIGRALGFSPGPLPEWGWLVFVVGVDVAHVWSTLFRTYFDRDELGRHPARYAGVPLLVYVAGVALHLAGSLVFWRVLAYVALFHFVRQQVGWVAVYRARSGTSAFVDRVLDDAVVYASTLYPVLVWHARMAHAEFSWFVRGDFVDFGARAEALVPAGRVIWIATLVAFAARQLALGLGSGSWQLGKSVVVATTAASWWVGIVLTNSDFEFTVTNVLVHGVPYFALLYAYARERHKEAPALLGSQIVAGGLGAFLGLVLLIAFVEELAWDHLIWHDRAWLCEPSELSLSPLATALIVPLLALPQATHYALDGLLWRRGDTRSRPAQRRALGFSS